MKNSIVLALCTVCYISAAPTTRPVVPPFRMTAELTGKVSKEEFIPIKLSFFSKDDSIRRYKTSDFAFILLDEGGQEVASEGAFITAAFNSPVELNGTVATYRPRIMIQPLRKDVLVGRRYQLVAFMYPTGLASSVWFTLMK